MSLLLLLTLLHVYKLAPDLPFRYWSPQQWRVNSFSICFLVVFFPQYFNTVKSYLTYLTTRIYNLECFGILWWCVMFLLCSVIVWPFSVCSILAWCFERGGWGAGSSPAVCHFCTSVCLCVCLCVCLRCAYVVI